LIHKGIYGSFAMSKSVLDAKALHDEAVAYAWVEARLWPDGPVCPLGLDYFWTPIMAYFSAPIDNAGVFVSTLHAFVAHG
jgi:hypothetical protein